MAVRVSRLMAPYLLLVYLLLAIRVNSYIPYPQSFSEHRATLPDGAAKFYDTMTACLCST